MASQEQINRLATAQRRISDLVRGQLVALFGSLDLSRPEAARDALLEFMPLLVSQFGPVSEQIALQWYEDVRANGFSARSAPNQVPRAAIEAKVRYAAGHLFTDSPGATLVALSGALDKYVKQSGRDAIAFSAESEGIRYARVPQGAKTCAFCSLLASRTDLWLYTSQQTAKFSKSGEKYHGDCDCAVVPVESEDDFPDPHARREMFEMYRESTDAVGSMSDTQSILADMRRRFPDRFNDGVVPAVV